MPDKPCCTGKFGAVQSPIRSLTPIKGQLAHIWHRTPEAGKQLTSRQIHWICHNKVAPTTLLPLRLAAKQHEPSGFCWMPIRLCYCSSLVGTRLRVKQIPPFWCVPQHSFILMLHFITICGKIFHELRNRCLYIHFAGATYMYNHRLREIQNKANGPPFALFWLHCLPPRTAALYHQHLADDITFYFVWGIQNKRRALTNKKCDNLTQPLHFWKLPHFVYELCLKYSKHNSPKCH